MFIANTPLDELTKTEPPVTFISPCTVIVALAANADILIEPPVATVIVTTVEALVPTVHVAAGMVMACATVHVSPGVVKLVGEAVPFVQFARLLIAPAVPVVHAVAKPSNPMQQSIAAKISVLAAIRLKWAISFTLGKTNCVDVL